MSQIAKLTAKLIGNGVDLDKVMDAMSQTAIESAVERAEKVASKKIASHQDLPVISSYLKSAGTKLAVLCSEAEKSATTPEAKAEVVLFRNLSGKALALFAELESKAAIVRATNSINNAKAKAEKLLEESALRRENQSLKDRLAAMEEAATAPQQS